MTSCMRRPRKVARTPGCTANRPTVLDPLPGPRPTESLLVCVPDNPIPWQKVPLEIWLSVHRKRACKGCNAASVRLSMSNMCSINAVFSFLERGDLTLTSQPDTNLETLRTSSVELLRSRQTNTRTISSRRIPSKRLSVTACARSEKMIRIASITPSERLKSPVISGSPAQCPYVDLMVFVRTDNVGVAWQEFDCEGGFLRIEFKCWKIRI
mmetsp:Transcript_4031/g.11456  ORF Transcript_4031/g.11456 Transcript_4031/m.11456 type:complete len:211 (+) Transcript_4031:2111-2743(+)